MYHFDSQVQSNRNIVYALFTTPENSIAGSAVCVFTMEEIRANFANSAFKSQSTVNANWLPMSKAQTPDPRPGQCSSKELKVS